MKIPAFLSFISLVLISCLDQPDCVHTNNDQVGISFKTLYDNRADTVKIVSVRATGTKDVFDSLKAVSYISLPLNYLTGTTAFNIRTIDRNYFLNFSFSVKPQFLTEDCPERFVLSDLALLGYQGVDSIKQISSGLSNPAQGNIIIYRCPKNTIMKLSFRQWYMDTVARGKLDTRSLISITDDFSGTVYSNVSANTVFLPLNISGVNTLFTFSYSDGTTNKVQVGYVVALKTIFSMCPNQKFPDNLKVLQNDYEVLHLRRDSIYDPPRTNIELFRCPITNQVTAVFKDANGLIVSDTLKSVTADYRPDTLYRNVIRNTVVLPLNKASDNTTFKFQFKSKTALLTLGYTRTDQTYHGECGVQTSFTKMLVAQSTGFSKDPKVTEPTVKFPTVTNVEIVQ